MGSLGYMGILESGNTRAVFGHMKICGNMESLKSGTHRSVESGDTGDRTHGKFGGT